MKVLVGMLLGWCLSKIVGSQLQKLLPKTKAAAGRNSFPIDDDDEGFTVETRDVSPAHFLTKIESFSLFSEYGIRKYESKEFEVGDYKWRLIIYPYGKEKDDSHVSVYLAMAETSSLPIDWEFNANFTIFLYNQIADNYLCFRVNGVRRFNETKSNWGFSKFISTESLKNKSNGYLVDDNFVLGAEVFCNHNRQRVIENVTLLRRATYPYTRAWKIVGFSKLEDVWESEEFTIRDVNWKVMLYPNGYSSSKGRDLSVFLVCVSAGARKRIMADFRMRLKNGLNLSPINMSEKSSRWFTSANKCWGFCDFISLDTLLDLGNYFIVNDCFTIEVEISVQIVVV
ncbi:hypothetical protein ABFX02_05G040400 [Erythranthe guttata]